MEASTFSKEILGFIEYRGRPIIQNIKICGKTEVNKVRELSREEYNKIKPLIVTTSYGLNNHSIFNTYENAVNCIKPISLNGSGYKGRKNKVWNNVLHMLRR